MIRKQNLPALVMVMLAAGLTWLAPNIDQRRAAIFPRKAAGELTATDLVMDLLGEIRTTLASYLWVQSDFYHHEYEFQNLDWRKNTSYVPMLKIITTLDPHFVKAYEFGGYHLAVDLRKVPEGLDYLQEGLRNNPKDYSILNSLAYAYYNEGLHQPTQQDSLFNAAIEYYQKALQSATDPIDQMGCLRFIGIMSYKLGVTAQAAGRFREAAQAYKRGITAYHAIRVMSPEDPGAARQLKRFNDRLKSLPQTP